jgi:hypothetical protein
MPKDKEKSSSFISRNKHKLLVIVLIVSALSNIVQLGLKDNLNKSQLKQVAYGHFVNDCFKVADTRFDCSKITVTEPKQDYFNIGGRHGWTVYGELGIDSENSLAAWTLEIDSTGKVLNLSHTSRYD